MINTRRRRVISGVESVNAFSGCDLVSYGDGVCGAER